jgi:hypothetical protein
MLRLDEVQAQAHRASDKGEFTLEVLPQGEGRHLVALKVNRRVLAQAELEQPGRVNVTLLTLGAPVAYDRIVVTGAIDPQLLEHARKLARESGNDADVVRRRLREDLDASSGGGGGERDRDRDRDRDADGDGWDEGEDEGDGKDEGEGERDRGGRR